jgi:hypothetical protein
MNGTFMFENDDDVLLISFHIQLSIFTYLVFQIY